MKTKLCLLIFSMITICFSTLTAAYCLFTAHTQKKLHATTGVSIQLLDNEKLTNKTIIPLSPTKPFQKAQLQDLWWCQNNTSVSISVSVKEGYIFDGWYQNNLKVIDQPQSNYTISGYTVLEPVVNLIDYRIIYKPNGGILEESSNIYNVENHVEFPLPVREGFSFEGWYLSPDFQDTPVTSTNGNLGDLFLYAKWKEIPADPVAFAIYSADDQSLSFYKQPKIPAIGSSYRGKTVTALYLGIEDMTIDSSADIPWCKEFAPSITQVTAVDSISPSNISYWFYQMFNCSSFELQNLDTSNVANMSYTFCSAGEQADIFSPNISQWDTSNVTDMSHMFYCAGRYSHTWNAGDINTKVISKEGQDSYLAWDVSKVENMTAMFGCAAETADNITFDISKWNISSALYLSQMFASFRANKSGAIIQLDLSTKPVTLEDGTSYTAWDLSNYSGSLYYMFGYLGKMAHTVQIDLSSWDVSKVTDMQRMFLGTGQNTTVFSLGDISCWNTGSVTNMASMFQYTGQRATYSLDLSNWNVSKVTSYSGFAYGTAGSIINPNF